MTVSAEPVSSGDDSRNSRASRCSTVQSGVAAGGIAFDDGARRRRSPLSTWVDRASPDLVVSPIVTRRPDPSAAISAALARYRDGGSTDANKSGILASLAVQRVFFRFDSLPLPEPFPKVSVVVQFGRLLGKALFDGRAGRVPGTTTLGRPRRTLIARRTNGF